MRKIEAERRKLNLEEFKIRGAFDSDIAELIKEPFELWENGRLLVVYEVLPAGSLFDLKQAVNSIQYQTTSRTGGMTSTSRIFGWSPRNTIRKDFCSATSLAREAPGPHDAIARAAQKAEFWYEGHNPTLLAKHREQALKVKPEYRLGGTVFTSGIVNENNPLKYHFDSGNFKDVWSAMFVFKDKIKGGHLALPEFNIGVELVDSSLLLFDGQGILHGVTPIRKTAADAKRHSVVYYSLAQMWKCEPLGAELTRIKKLRTEREEKRAEKGKS